MDWRRPVGCTGTLFSPRQSRDFARATKRLAKTDQGNTRVLAASALSLQLPGTARSGGIRAHQSSPLREGEIRGRVQPTKHFRTRASVELLLALITRLLKSGGQAAIVFLDGLLFGDGVKARLQEHMTEQCNLHTDVRLPNSVFRQYASIGTNQLFFEKVKPTQDFWFWEHLVPGGRKAYSMTQTTELKHLDGCAARWGEADRKDRQDSDGARKVSTEHVKERVYNLDIKNPYTENEDLGNPEAISAELNGTEAAVASVRDQQNEVLADALLR